MLKTWHAVRHQPPHHMLPHVLIGWRVIYKSHGLFRRKKSVNQITKAFYHDCIGRHQFRASGDEMKSIVTKSNRKLTMGPTAAAHYGTNSGGSEKWRRQIQEEKKSVNQTKAFYQIYSEWTLSPWRWLFYCKATHILNDELRWKKRSLTAELWCAANWRTPLKRLASTKERHD